MEITNTTTTVAFKESIGSFRFEGNFTKHNGKITDLHTSVAMIPEGGDEQNGPREDLGWINLRKVNGKDIKETSQELIQGITNLLNNMCNEEN